MKKKSNKKKNKVKIDKMQRNAVLGFVDYFKELFRKVYIYVLFVLIAIILANFYLSKQVSTYTAKLTFMTTADSNQSFSPLMQLAGQIGINPTSASALSSEKLVELMRSRLIILTTLMQKTEIEKKDDLLINHFSRIYEINNNYEDQPELKNIIFEQIDLDFFNEKENKVASDIYSTIVRDYLNAGTSKNGIITVSYTSDSELFAKQFLEVLVKTLSDFYVNKTNQKHRETYNIMQHYTDSLQAELKQSEFNLAEWKDKNVLKVKSKGILSELRLLRTVETLNVAYTESLKNLELAKFNLITSTPILQTIDKPILPLKRNHPNILFIYAIPIIVSIIFATILILVWKFFRDALS